MPHNVDDSTLVPKPPPPRPARRDAAIDAALQRFDGLAEAPSSPPIRQRSSWRAWGSRPQMGMALTACLVAVIGIPAALIVIRDGNSPAIEAPASSPAPQARQESVTEIAANQPTPPAEGAVAATAPAPVVTPPAQKQGNPTAALANEPADALAAAEAPPVAYAAAPPPPPPTAPMLAEKSADGNIVITGSRIRAPKVGREEIAAGRAENADAQAAPDWVRKDASYATFLKRLQSAVRTNDRGAVIKLIGLPLRVNSNGRSQVYADARSVRADYDRIFTPKVTRAILSQRPDRLLGRDQGLMIGDGEVWFDHICSNSACSPPGPVRVKAVNL